MADERDQWLDMETAERLLRGEPVEAADTGDGVRVKRLSDALRELSGVTYANGTELPGEGAALAAFRRGAGGGAAVGRPPARTPASPQARDRSPAGPRSQPAPPPRRSPAGGAGGGSAAAPPDAGGTAAQTLFEPTVRLAPLPGATRPARFGASLRTGLAAAVASCVLGGMAVAAGAGMLPSDVTTGHRPASAAPLPRAASPAPSLTGPPEGDGARSEGSGLAGTAGGTDRNTPAASGSAGGAQGDTTDGEAAAEPIGPVGRHRGWPDEDASEGTGGRADGPGSWYRRTADACRAYRSGKIDPARKDELERAAERPGGAGRFCDRLLDVKSGASGGKEPRGGGHGQGDGVKSGTGTGNGISDGGNGTGGGVGDGIGDAGDGGGSPSPSDSPRPAPSDSPPSDSPPSGSLPSVSPPAAPRPPADGRNAPTRKPSPTASATHRHAESGRRPHR